MALSPALEARNLYRFFHTADDEVFALQGVTLDVAAGEVVALRGPSGSGKSTLLACLAGLDEPDAGTVRLGGDQLTRRPEAVRAELRARRVGVLYQSANLVGHLTVRENVVAARRIARAGEDTATVDDLLRGLGIAGRAHAAPAQLSGGEAARAGLGVALANDPLVLLADEPTAEIDEATAAAVLWLLRTHADRGRAVVVATHSPAVAAVADRVVELVDGRVVA